ncbi:putative hydrolase [Hyaloraphidium curvatum]|nr:putative hydrolase [Hyaloraphidium curvatum]
MTEQTVKLAALGGQEVRFAVHGPPSAEKTLILLHANPGSPRDFDGVLRRLAARYRVVLLAFPGYGEGTLADPGKAGPELAAAVLRAFVRETAQPPTVLVGNSLGANAAVRLAAEEPGRVRGLVLVSPGGFTDHGFATRAFCRLMASPLAPSPATFGWFCTKKQEGKYAQELLLRYKEQHSAPEVVTAVRAAWRAFAEPSNDVRDVAKAITAKTLLVFGKYDPVIAPKSDGAQARAAMPGAEYAELATGHCVFAEDPDAFLEAVIPFIDGIF